MHTGEVARSAGSSDLHRRLGRFTLKGMNTTTGYAVQAERRRRVDLLEEMLAPIYARLVELEAGA